MVASLSRFSAVYLIANCCRSLIAYILSRTQKLSSQLSQLGFDEIDQALFRVHELEKKQGIFEGIFKPKGKNHDSS